MTTISDLPEEVLVELLSLLPARELIHTCRLVCKQWRDVVDLQTLWRRKCQRDGFYPQNLDRNVSDWRIYYMLCPLKGNLIKNPCAEENFNHWTIDDDNEWKFVDLRGAHGNNMPDPTVETYFMTTYGSRPCFKSQLITLKHEGYWSGLMDEKRPEITVKDWFNAKADRGCRYQLRVILYSQEFYVLQEFRSDPVVIEQRSDGEWREITHTFQNYPKGVRHIWFQHGGEYSEDVTEWYGIRVTNSSVTIGLQTLLSSTV